MTTVNLTKYSVDNQSYPELKDICIDDKIKTAAIIGGQKAMNSANRLIKESLEGSTIKILGEFLHGQVVAFGVMVLHAYAGNDNELKKIAEFNKEVKLPTKLSDINLNYNDLDIIADEAMKTNEWKKALEEFSREKFIDAIKKADQYGRSLNY